MSNPTPIDSAQPAPNEATDLNTVLTRAWETLSKEGQQEVIDRAAEAYRTPPRAPVITVIGEVKRGKSSLVNCLLGGRDLSPVDVDIATSAFLRFVPADGERQDGAASLVFAGSRRRDVQLSELGDWVTENGSRVTDPEVDALPVGAEIAVAGEFLPGTVLVDTPGVGGLNPSHLRLATERAREGSVLLMTCDAGAPISGPELKFLHSVSEEIETVVIAVTKIDKYPRAWRDIVTENQRLLREHTRFIATPVIGVSNVRARAALRMDLSDPRREKALAASGLTDLVTVLRERTGSTRRLATVNCLRILVSGLERVSSRLDQERAAIEGQSSSAHALTAQRERLQDQLKELDNQNQGSWREFLYRDIDKVRIEVSDMFERRLEALRSEWRTRIDTAEARDIRECPQRFISGIASDLDGLVDEVSAEFVEAVARLELPGNITFTTEGLGRVQLREHEHRRTKVWEPQMAAMGFVGVTGTNLAGPGVAAVFGVTGAAVAAVTVPLGLMLGAGWVAVNYYHKAAKLGRGDLERWLSETVNAVRRDLIGEINIRIIDLRPAIVDAVRRYYMETIAELRRQVQLAKESERATQDERDALLHKTARRKATIEAVISDLKRQLAAQVV